MTPDEIKKIIDTALDQVSLIKWWHFLLWMFLSAIGAYFGTYFREKGKNVATKEDIGRITDEIEKVKSIYAKEIENVRERQQLKLAAIEKRLECHQNAYALWRKLVYTTHNSDEIGRFVVECQEWWNNNCLYLSPKARESFLDAVFCASNHKDFLQDRSNIKLIQDNWKKIMAAGKDISEEAGLPSLIDYEDKSISENGEVKKITPVID